MGFWGSAYDVAHGAAGLELDVSDDDDMEPYVGAPSFEGGEPHVRSFPNDDADDDTCAGTSRRGVASLLESTKGAVADLPPKKRARSEKRRRRVRDAIMRASVAADSSLLAGRRTPEVLVNPRAVAKIAEMLERDSTVKTAIRVFSQSLLSGVMRVSNEHGAQVELSRENTDELNGNLLDVLDGMITSASGLGVAPVAASMVEVYTDESRRTFLLTPDGRGVMRPHLWTPRMGTYALTTWLEGPHQRFAVYQFVPFLQGEGLAQNTEDQRNTLTGAAGKRAERVLNGRMSLEAYTGLGGTRSANYATGVPGLYVYNPHISVVAMFGEPPNPVTGALNSRVAAALCSIEDVKAADSMYRQWMRYAISGRYYYQENERTGARMAEVMAKPEISGMLDPGVINPRPGDPAAAAYDDGVQIGTTPEQMAKRTSALVASVRHAEEETYRAKAHLRNVIGDDEISRMQREEPGFGSWTVAPTQTELKEFRAPPQMPRQDEHHQMRLQEASAALGVERSLYVTPAGRQPLGYAALPMDTFRHGLTVSRRWVNVAIRVCLSLAHRAVAVEREYQRLSRARSERRLVEFQDIFWSAPERRGAAAYAVGSTPRFRVTFPATSYMTQDQAMLLYGLGVYDWSRFLPQIMRSTGADPTDAEGLPAKDPNPPEFRRALVKGVNLFGTTSASTRDAGKTADEGISRAENASEKGTKL